MLPFLLKLTSKLYDFPSNNSQFECQFLQLSEHRKGFLLRKIAFQSDYTPTLRNCPYKVVSFW